VLEESMVKRVLAGMVVLAFAVGSAAMVAPLFFLRPDVHRAAPTRLRIPAIGLDAPIDQVGATAGGALEMPADAGHLGWYRRGVRPGQPGDAVLAGLLRRDGAIPLGRLTDLRAGDRIEVGLADGTSLAFEVASAGPYAANRQPADLFATGGPPRLSLVASAGSSLAGAAGPARIVVEATLRQAG
jgi:hypothetical protein